MANIRLNWRGSVSVPALAAVRAGDLRGRSLQVVRAEAELAVAAVDHRVAEAGDVAGGLPDARVHDDRRVDALDVVAQLDHVPPPGRLDVVLELDAERAVVPEAGHAAIDLARREDEAASLGEAGDDVEVRRGHRVLDDSCCDRCCGRVVESTAGPPCRAGAHGANGRLARGDLRQEVARCAARVRARPRRRACSSALDLALHDRRQAQAQDADQRRALEVAQHLERVAREGPSAECGVRALRADDTTARRREGVALRLDLGAAVQAAPQLGSESHGVEELELEPAGDHLARHLSRAGRRARRAPGPAGGRPRANRPRPRRSDPPARRRTTPRPSSAGRCAARGAGLRATRR